ncbi:MAG: AAA family ATPase [Candidatus Sabulitectum sp.]|nr:AAA family ATPase [Candidatus Sabulitectum sp.]
MDGLQLDLSGVINKAIDDKMAGFDVEGQIKDMLAGVAEKASKILTVKLEGEKGEGRKFPLVHKQFETLLKISAVKGLNVLLTGGAGLAKSTAVEQLAEAYKLKFASISFSNQTTKTDLLGFVDANGIYRKSGFVDAFEDGKIFLADEMDACSANVLVLLNSAISNGFIETPDNKIINAHDNFRFVGTANTNLRGAKDGFTARNKLDSATIDRFVVIEWQLDEELEQKITNNDGWLAIVRKCRETANNNLEGVAITPRSSYDGAKLLKVGIPIDSVINMVIIKAMGEDESKTLLKGITSNMKSVAIKGGGVKAKETKKVEAFKW